MWVSEIIKLINNHGDNNECACVICIHTYDTLTQPCRGFTNKIHEVFVYKHQNLRDAKKRL